MRYLLGVRPRYYPESVRASWQLLNAFMIARTYTAGQDGADLIESFPRAFLPRARPTSRRYFRELYAYRLMCAYCGYLIRPRTRASYALPPVFPWIGLLFARAPIIAASEIARRLVPGFAGWLERRGAQKSEAWYALQMAGRKAMFEAKF